MKPLLQEIFGVSAPAIGMVHLRALPGAPAHVSMNDVLDHALRDVHALAAGGVHGIMIENFGDTPFYPDRVPAETVAAMTRVIAAVRAHTTLPLGVNVLRNDAHAALAIAVATEAAFIRVNVHTGAMLTDQGWIDGRAYDTLRARTSLRASVAIFADVLVKHAVAWPGVDIADAARDTWERGRADALIVSGVATGAAVDPDRLRTVRAAVPDAPLLIGSGVTAETAPALFQLADGAVIGSAFQQNGRAGAPVDVARVRRIIDALPDS